MLPLHPFYCPVLIPPPHLLCMSPSPLDGLYHHATMYNYVETKYLKEGVLVRDDNGSVAYTVFMMQVMLSFLTRKGKGSVQRPGERAS